MYWKPTSDAAWVLEAEGYDPLREGSIESRFAISNGFLGVRARTGQYAWSALGRSAAHLCRRVVRHARHRARHTGACPSRRLAEGPHLCCLAGLWCITLAMRRRTA